jgi:acetylornithine deacetylase
MAAMLVAIDRLRAAGTPRRAHVVFTATVNEEFGFSGARAVARLWGPAADGLSAMDRQARELCGGPPIAAVVAEPTELDIVTQHKGAVRWRVRVHGRACHSAFPERGDNAIHHAGRAIQAIEALAHDVRGLRRDLDDSENRRRDQIAEIRDEVNRKLNRRAS